MQIADLFFVDQEGVGVDQKRLGFEVVLFKELGEFDAAFGEDGVFESRDAEKTPIGIGDGLHELAFAETDRFIFFLESGEVALVGGGVIGGEQDGAASETGFDGVERRFGLAFRRGRAGGKESIRAIRGETRGGWSGRS